MSTDHVTRSEFELAMSRIEARFDSLEGRMNSRFDVSEARVDAKIEAAMATTIRWVVGMAFGQYALIFGLVLFVITREAAR